MVIREVQVQRFSVTSSHSFHDVLRKIELAVGHPNMSTFRAEVASATTYADLAKVVEREVGPSGLMEFTRFDLGEILRKHHGPEAPHVVRLVVGNRLIMKEIVEVSPVIRIKSGWSKWPAISRWRKRAFWWARDIYFTTATASTVHRFAS